jgi:hypothetical protein
MKTYFLAVYAADTGALVRNITGELDTVYLNLVMEPTNSKVVDFTDTPFAWVSLFGLPQTFDECVDPVMWTAPETP